MLYVTGHSMGAALTHLAMFTLQNAGYRVAKTYSYEAPRIGNKAFADAFSSRFSREFPVFRVTHSMDPVPHLPPQFLGYEHVPTEVWYDAKGNYTVCNEVQQTSKQWFCKNDGSAESDCAQHGEEYNWCRTTNSNWDYCSLGPGITSRGWTCKAMVLPKAYVLDTAKHICGAEPQMPIGIIALTRRRTENVPTGIGIYPHCFCSIRATTAPPAFYRTEIFATQRVAQSPLRFRCEMSVWLYEGHGAHVVRYMTVCVRMPEGLCRLPILSHR